MAIEEGPLQGNLSVRAENELIVRRVEKLIARGESDLLAWESELILQGENDLLARMDSNKTGDRCQHERAGDVDRMKKVVVGHRVGCCWTKDSSIRSRKLVKSEGDQLGTDSYRSNRGEIDGAMMPPHHSGYLLDHDDGWHGHHCV
jgi:hypothetical protein